MLLLPRALARSFRAVVRHSLLAAEGPRAGWPPVHCSGSEAGLVLQCSRGDVGLRHVLPGPQAREHLVFSAALLAEFEGRREEPVTLERKSKGQGQARWQDGAVPRRLAFDLLDADKLQSFPDLPHEWSPAPPALLTALDVAAQTAAREPTKFALRCVQLRGKSGQIIATDSKQLLIQEGFSFPWQEDLLVPRVPAFGHPDVRTATPVQLGRTKTHVAIQAGPWLFVLAIDTQGRFPPVHEVVPKPVAITARLGFDSEEAKFLLHALPKLPGIDLDSGAITVELGTPPAVRAKGPDEDVTEVPLVRSTASGAPLRFCCDRRYLLRALQLGFRELQVAKPHLPCVCRDSQRTFVFMPLAAESAIPPTPHAQPIAPPERVLPRTETSERRPQPMSAPARNGKTPPPVPVAAANTDPLDPLIEVEALRGLLHDALLRCQRLHAALKQQRRVTRTVSQAVASLRGLQIHP